MDSPPIEEAADIIRDWLHPVPENIAQRQITLLRAPDGRLICRVVGHDKKGRCVASLAELDESADLTCQMAATVLSWQEEHAKCVLN